MLLLVRAVLFLIFTANVTANLAVNLLATILTAFSLLAHGAIAGQVYKRWYLNISETIILRLSKLRERVKLAVSHKRQCQSAPSRAHNETAIQLCESLLEYCTDD